MKLKDKVAIVTGGGSGIGHHASLHMGREGARILVVDIAEERAQRVAREVAANGGIAEAIKCDVSSEQGAQEIVGRAETLWKRVDILVNNAASFHHRSAEQATEDDWERVLKVNVLGTSFCTKYVVPIMKRQRSGSIINVASINGLVAMDGDWMTYSATKAAIVNMSKSLAKEYASFGVRVNSVCPGMIHTPAMEELLVQLGLTRKQAEDDFLGPRCMLKRFGEAWEIAPVIVLLASDEASYVTGATFVVDGGYAS